MNKKLSLAAMAVVLVATAGTLMISRPAAVRASDHDDGETDTKSRNTNLTDVFAFKEEDQATVNENGGAIVAGQNLIIAVNLNPRSLPRQQYFFNQSARYTIHIGNTASSLTNPTGLSNVDLQLFFGAPNANGEQAITVNEVQQPNNVAAATGVSAGLTQQDNPGIGTPPTSGAGSGINSFSLTNTDGTPANFTVFAGLRQDPFFFDVTQFFRVRAGLVGAGPAVAFRGTGNAVDFTKDYNVLSIVLRAPIKFLQQGTTNQTFDVFATIEQPN
jgi:hypothetical protein